MQGQALVSLITALAFFTKALAAPSQAGNDLSARQDDCECAVCEVDTSLCEGDDYEALVQCQKTVLGECGRSCTFLPSQGAVDACLIAEISIQKPCENECVQKALSASNCETMDPDDEFYDKYCS